MANVLNPNSAGIDLASREHYVAVPKDRSEQNVRCFKSFTRDLHNLASWLQDCKIETIAMESTGVYWYDLYTILLDYGFEVFLVNAYHVKNVPGRKSDVSDAQWLQQLHSYGLLNGCFQPDNKTRELRSYVRLRKQIVREIGKETQRMQKALDQMNIKLNNVIRDLNGKTGRTIITKIIAGERCAKKLAEYKDPGIKADTETLEKSLEGNWREEQLFNLKIAYDRMLFLEEQLKECDKKSEVVVSEMASDDIEPKKIKRERKQKHQPDFNVAEYLYAALGTDVTKIYGLKSTTALTVFSETGPNLKSKFPTAKQFLSWLNLVPDNKISGGKILSSKVKRKKNIAGQAFRDAANALWQSQNPLGDYLRRKKAKSSGPQAIVATARKIASIYYHIVTNQIEFNQQKVENDSVTHHVRKLKYLEKQLEKVKKQIPEYQTPT